MKCPHLWNWSLSILKESMKLIEQVKTKNWIKLTKHQIQAKEIVSWRKWMTSNIDELNGIDENIN